MTFREVSLAMEGLKNKHLINFSTIRRATFLIMSSYIGSDKAGKAVKKGFPIEDIDGSKEDWLTRAKNLIKKADERSDKEKVKKVLNGGGA